jgi:hypothetical protein
MILKNNQGTAIILSLLIVSVLFILTSFLVRKVLTNTTMVEKTGEEQKSYALAKQGILYALDQLNTSEGYSPKYDPTDWPGTGDTNWHDYNLDKDTTTGNNSGNDVTLKVEKNTPSGYITIKSQDLPKRLITLEGIAKNNTPLFDYVKFINSDVTFSSPQTLGGLFNGSPFHVNGNLTLTGTNNIYLDTTRNDKFEIAQKILATASSDTVNILDKTGTYLAANLNAVANDGGNNGFSLVYDVTNSKWVKEPGNFNTASGHYFDGGHLPSSYDRSDPDNPQYVWGDALLLWPQIKTSRYEKLVGGTSSLYYISCSSVDESENWYPSFPPSIGTGWRKDSSITGNNSYSYKGTGTLVVLDGNGKISGTAGQVGIDDGEGDEVANNNVIESGEWRSYPINGVIYSPGNLRVLGIIGDNLPLIADYELTIVSGGTIYIESNLVKGTSGSSLALIAKGWVTLNPTHRFINQPVVATSGPDTWNNQDKIQGESDGILNRMDITVSKGTTQDTAVLSVGQKVCVQKIILKNINLPESGDDLILRIYASNDSTPSIMSNDVKFDSNYIAETIDEDIIFDREAGPLTFRYIKLNLQNNSATNDYTARFDAVEVQLTEINAFCFAQDNSWAVVSGNLSGYPFIVNGAISENKLEHNSNWSSNWPSITYTHDSTLPSNLALPPSVNLVSLKRK